MSELTRTEIGEFTVEDSLIASDPMGEGLLFAAAPGSWTIYKLEDATYTQELMVMRSNIDPDRELLWIPEAEELEIQSGLCGFYAPDSEEVSQKEARGRNFAPSAAEAKSGTGAGFYNLVLSYNKRGEAVAAKVIFIDDASDGELPELYLKEAEEWFSMEDYDAEDDEDIDYGIGDYDEED